MSNTFYSCNDRYYLKHYGVLGMRWGHRKDDYRVGGIRRRRHLTPEEKAKLRKAKMDRVKQIRNDTGINFNSKHGADYGQTLANKRGEFKNVRQREDIKRTRDRLDKQKSAIDAKQKEIDATKIKWNTDLKDIKAIKAKKKSLMADKAALQKNQDKIASILNKQELRLAAREKAAKTIIDTIPDLPPLQDNYVDLTYKGHPIASLNYGDIVKFGLSTAYTIYQIVDDTNNRYDKKRP